MADDLDNLVADCFEVDAEALETLGCDTFALVDQPEQDVLGADVVVVQQPRLFLRKHHHAAGSVREPLKHDLSPSDAAALGMTPWRCADYSQGVSLALGRTLQSATPSGPFRIPVVCRT